MVKWYICVSDFIFITIIKFSYYIAQCLLLILPGSLFTANCIPFKFDNSGWFQFLTNFMAGCGPWRENALKRSDFRNFIKIKHAVCGERIPYRSLYYFITFRIHNQNWHYLRNYSHYIHYLIDHRTNHWHRVLLFLSIPSSLIDLYTLFTKNIFNYLNH